jgi:hypothetical protein
LKKSDLKTGMRVETVSGELYIVLTDYTTINYGHQDIFFCGKNGFLIGEKYDDQLRRGYDEADYYSVKRVYACPGDGHVLDLSEKGKLLWEREEPKEMTIEEIQQKLGYKIKVVESHK